MDSKRELQRMEKELSGLYRTIAERYKHMSKVNDNWRLDGIQSGINYMLAQATVVCGRIDTVRKRIMDD